MKRRGFLKKFRVNLLLQIPILLIASCVFSNEEINPETYETEFQFPESFEFLDSKDVQVSWSSQTGQRSGVVEVYLSDNELKRLGTFGSQSHSQSFRVPSTANEMILVFRSGSGQNTAVFSLHTEDDVHWNLPTYSGQSSTRTTSENCVDRLFAVENSFGGFWEIDLRTGAYEEFQLPNLQGGGSIACALDQENNRMFYNINRTLYSYDIGTSTFTTVHTSNPFGRSYPRMAYKDGKIYMSNGNTLHVVDAVSNQVDQSYTIQGFINNNGGGDIDFASDGTLYLSCFSGLYKFTSFEGSTAQIERISAENFPYQLTSMAVDRQDRIFVGTNDSNSHLIEMDKADGSFQIVRTYNHKINDLTAWRCELNDLPQEDNDGDGIINELDDYPNDPEAAYDVFTPSEIGYGTLAFEDMWPARGDYDFNDMVINYRFTNVLNSNNESVRLEIDLKLVAAGATLENGFGIELPVDKEKISSVTGHQLTESFILLDAKGLEANQSKAVIIPFDNAMAQFNVGSLVNTITSRNQVEPVEVEMVINFTEPIESSSLSNAPFNPFIFVGQDRSREVHLRNGAPTDLANLSLFNTIEDHSDALSGRYYLNAENVPWGIDMIHNFRFPIEKTRIDQAYNYFIPWGKSSGIEYLDWYKDNNGYRNDSKLMFID